MKRWTQASLGSLVYSKNLKEYWSKSEHCRFKVKTITISQTFRNLWDEHPYKLLKTNDRKRLDSATKVKTFLLFWIFIIKEIIPSFAIDEFYVLLKMSFAKL